MLHTLGFQAWHRRLGMWHQVPAPVLSSSLGHSSLPHPRLSLPAMHSPVRHGVEAQHLCCLLTRCCKHASRHIYNPWSQRWAAVPAATSPQVWALTCLYCMSDTCYHPFRRMAIFTNVKPLLKKRKTKVMPSYNVLVYLIFKLNKDLQVDRFN